MRRSYPPPPEKFAHSSAATFYDLLDHRPTPRHLASAVRLGELRVDPGVRVALGDRLRVRPGGAREEIEVASFGRDGAEDVGGGLVVADPV